MNPEQLRAIALEKIREMDPMDRYFPYRPDTIELCIRFLAAIAKKSEPVALDAIYAAWHGAGVDIAGGRRLS